MMHDGLPRGPRRNLGTSVKFGRQVDHQIKDVS